MSLPEASPDATNAASLSRESSQFDGIYSEHFPFVWRCLRSLGVPDAALDDAAQEVFLVVHRRIDGFRGESELRTWLYGIVRNVASNQRRSIARRGAMSPIDERLPGGGQGPHDSAESAELKAFIANFIERLDERKRDVFVLALLEELSVPEVAGMLGIPLNTAYTRLRAVRSEFRDALVRRGIGL